MQLELARFGAWLHGNGRNSATARQYAERVRALLVDTRDPHTLEDTLAARNLSEGYYRNALSALNAYRQFQKVGADVIDGQPSPPPAAPGDYPSAIVRLFWRLVCEGADAQQLLEAPWSTFDVHIREPEDVQEYNGRRHVLFAGKVLYSPGSDAGADAYVSILRAWGGWEKSPNNYRAIVFPEAAGRMRLMSEERLLRQLERLRSEGTLDDPPLLNFFPRSYASKERS